MNSIKQYRILRSTARSKNHILNSESCIFIYNARRTQTASHEAELCFVSSAKKNSNETKKETSLHLWFNGSRDNKVFGVFI